MEFKDGDLVVFDPNGPNYAYAHEHSFWGLDPHGTHKLRMSIGGLICITSPSQGQLYFSEMNYFVLAPKRSLNLDSFLKLLRAPL